MMTKLAIALLTVFCMSIPVVGQTLDCTQFRHNEDGLGHLSVSSQSPAAHMVVRYMLGQAC